MLLSKQMLNIREKTKSFPQKLHRIGKYKKPKFWENNKNLKSSFYFFGVVVYAVSWKCLYFVITL